MNLSILTASASDSNVTDEKDSFIGKGHLNFVYTYDFNLYIIHM